MRRRPRPTAVVEPPARLVALDVEEWLPLVNAVEYDRAGQSGEPQDFDEWSLMQAHRLWSSARHAWLAEHGWPGGLTMLDLLRQDVTERRRAVREEISSSCGSS